ncbi:hypothetical protein J25TS5_36970 [Paenibacillus faecis]|uniref:hypothetical protein n=1 Tax=Paenibacillus faecis TaxID=862114 RepID=UPI001B0031A5|nr:hypothetical protein [Paenibacillus faecis]GIO86765.1 hypothetical protein J25TS5_36970 [Paenibacillus faecis]
MIKTCKCGNVLSDAVIPNKNVYRAYLEEEWQVRKKWYADTSLKTTIRDFWYCDRCERIYSRVPINNFYYTFIVDDGRGMNGECKCLKNERYTTKFYVLNDDDEDEAWDCVVDKAEEPTFLREFRYCFDCKRVYIKEGDKERVYKVEDVYPYKNRRD